MAREAGPAGRGTAAFLEEGREEGDADVMVIHGLETLQVGW